MQVRTNGATNMSNGTFSTAFFSSGNVGIGTTTDSGYKLDVNGTINATEYVKSGLNISNIFTTSNVITNNYYSKANLDAIVSSQKVYTNKLYANENRFCSFCRAGSLDKSRLKIALTSASVK